MTVNGLPKGWRRARIGDVFKVVGGGTPSTMIPRFWKGTIPWVTSADLESNLRLAPRKLISKEAVRESATNLVPKNSVIVATRVGLGRVGITEGDTCFSQDCQALLPAPDLLDPRFVAHQLSVATKGFQHNARGTTISGVTKKQLLDLEFDFPELDVQRQVVAKIEQLFSDLDASVAALERAKANLVRYRAAVISAGVEGRLTGYWRQRKLTIAPAHDANTPPPVMWTKVSLAETARFQNGRAFPSKEYALSGVKLLRPGNLFADGSVRWTDGNTRCLPHKWETSFPAYVVRGGELVMNLTAQSLADEFLGRVCMTAEGDHCLLNQRLARITPVEGVAPRFLLWALKSKLFRRFVNGLNSGSLIQHMFTSDLRTFEFHLPPIDEQREIVRIVEKRLAVIGSVEATIADRWQQAKILRQSILASAFAGRLPTDEVLIA